MSFDKEMPGGLRPEEAMAIAHQVVGWSPGTDFFSIIRGYVGDDEALSRVVPDRHTQLRRIWSSPARSSAR